MHALLSILWFSSTRCWQCSYCDDHPDSCILCVNSPFKMGKLKLMSMIACAGENFVASNKQQPQKAVGKLTKSKIQPFGSYRANQARVDVEPTESVVESSGSPLAPAKIARNVRTKDSQEAPDCVSVNIGNSLPAAQSPRKTSHDSSNKSKQGANQNASKHKVGRQESSSGMQSVHLLLHAIHGQRLHYLLDMMSAVTTQLSGA
jgi:hypothetical protein